MHHSIRDSIRDSDAIDTVPTIGSMTTRVDDFWRARLSALSASIRSKGIPILSLVRFLFLLSFFLSDGRVDDS